MKAVLASLGVILVFVAAGLAQQPAVGDPTVIGQVEHEGFALVGSRGRFYVFGGIAMADYRDSAGTRRIVTLSREDQIQDARHEHYRELREGHRWAFSREAGSDGLHGVWIQLAAAADADRVAAPPKWLPYQRARKEESREAAANAPSPVAHRGRMPEICCNQ